MGPVTYEGKPCKHCGCTTRYITNGACRNRFAHPMYAAQEKARAARWYQANKDLSARLGREWRQSNKDYMKAYYSAAHAANKDFNNAASADWRARNKEYYTALKAASRKKHKETANAQQRIYRAKKRNFERTL